MTRNQYKPKRYLKRYQVIGSEMGRKVTLTINAYSEDEAEQVAIDHGMNVERVRVDCVGKCSRCTASEFCDDALPFTREDT